MKDVQQQIQDRCIHFTGMRNKVCKMNVNYDNVKDKSSSPFKIPCLLNTAMSDGNINCDLAEFPTAEQAKKEADEAGQSMKYTLKTMQSIREKHKKDKLLVGTVDCLKCGNDLNYTIASNNGHIHAACSTCEIGWME